MKGWKANLIVSIPRNQDSSLPHVLIRFWKFYMDVKIIKSKFVWKFYPPIPIRGPLRDVTKQLEMYF